MTESAQTVPVACSLTATELTDQVQRWRWLGSRAGIAVHRRADGLTVVFHNGRGVREELAALAALERECCPFAEWSTHDDGDEVILTVVAQRPEAVQAGQEMYDGFAATIPASRQLRRAVGDH